MQIIPKRKLFRIRSESSDCKINMNITQKVVFLMSKILYFAPGLDRIVRHMGLLQDYTANYKQLETNDKSQF